VYNIDDIPGLAPEEGAYTGCAEFIQDVRMLQTALLKEGSDRLANGVVKDLLRLAETFGFHLASLDIRQESGRHEEAVRTHALSPWLDSTSTSTSTVDDGDGLGLGLGLIPTGSG